MKVFHGSHIRIDVIDLALCKPYKNFDKGFYVTKIHSQAKAWADRTGRERGTEGVVTVFNFCEAAYLHWQFQTLRFEGYTGEWLDFIVKNRDRQDLVPAHDYDLVEGPVADDDIAGQIEKFLSGRIAKAIFLEELQFRVPTHQICFCTQRSLQALERIDPETVPCVDARVIEALVADYHLSEREAVDVFFDSKTYAQLQEGVEWQEVYRSLRDEKGLIMK
jgi:hypothetical protein